MTTTIKLTLANKEANRLFTRKTAEGKLFYKGVIQKITMLLRRCEAQQAYSLLSLHQMQASIHKLTNQFSDELDKFEGLLEKKRHLNGKIISFGAKFYPVCNLDSSLASDLVELVEVYDKLLSTLKLLRVAGSFASDEDYFANLRRFFKEINKVLSGILLTPVNGLPKFTFEEVVDESLTYQLTANFMGKIDYQILYDALTSNLAPRLEEKIRQPLLHRLKKKLRQHEGHEAEKNGSVA